MCLSVLPYSTLTDKGFIGSTEWNVVRHPMGHECGYVRLLPGHPWFGLDYDDIEPCPEINGGLTFSDYGNDCNTHKGKDEYWIGFDNNHFEVISYDEMVRQTKALAQIVEDMK